MLTKINFLLGVFICLLFVTAAFSQTESGAKVQLSLAGGKTVYKTGEPIRLVLSFTAAASDGYQLNTTTTKPASPVDDAIVTPDAGVYHWLDLYSGAARYYPDYSSITNLSETPIEVKLPLNQWYRFERPGHYSVRVKTNRVWLSKNTIGSKEPFNSVPPLSLITNEVSFDIEPMSEKEEEAEVRKLSASIDASTDWREQTKYAEDLSYLTGDIAAAEKVKRFLHPPSAGPGNFYQAIFYGLYISKNQDLVIKLLEDELHNRDTEAASALLNILTGLRLMQERAAGKMLVPADNKAARQREINRAVEIRKAYLKELADSLQSRTEKSLRASALTILGSLPRDIPKDDPVLIKVREILLREFDNLSLESDQEYLLRVYWDKIRDPVLLPKLEKILQNYHGQDSLNVRTTALERLWDLSPERARPFFVEEIKDPKSLVELELLGKLNDSVLPEADAALLEQIRMYAQGNNPVYLRNKTMRAARFASPAIYDELMKIYQAESAHWQFEARGSLLAFFARYNEKEAVPLIEKELANSGQIDPFSFINSLTRSYYSNGINEILIKRLAGEDPQTVSSAAYFMSVRGPAADEPLIRARLERWRKEWSGRAAEIESKDSYQKIKLQSVAERELISALINAKSWKLPDEQILQLKQGCLTKACRDTVQIH